MEVTKELLKEKFDKYNKQYFDGKLGKCKFYFLLKSDDGFGKYNAQPKNGEIISKIYIGQSTEWNEEKLKEILVHEMIHMYVATVEGVILDGLLGHGWRFRRQRRRIRKQFGLRIDIHPKFELKKGYKPPKLWEKVVLWIIDR